MNQAQAISGDTTIKMQAARNFIYWCGALSLKSATAVVAQAQEIERLGMMILDRAGRTLESDLAQHVDAAESCVRKMEEHIVSLTTEINAFRRMTNVLERAGELSHSKEKIT